MRLTTALQDYTATYTDATNATDPCAVVITRTWSLTDNCGNTTTHPQTITVVDLTVPTFTAPANIQISCEQDDLDLTITGDVTDEADRLLTGLQATYTDATNATDPCAVVITRTLEPDRQLRQHNYTSSDHYRSGSYSAYIHRSC